LGSVTCKCNKSTCKKKIKKEKIKAKQQHDKKAKEVKFNVGVKILVYDETLRSKKLESL